MLVLMLASLVRTGLKAAVASLQARELAERVRRDNEISEREFQEEMAQRELEWKLECRKRELDLLRKKREDEICLKPSGSGTARASNTGSTHRGRKGF